MAAPSAEVRSTLFEAEMRVRFQSADRPQLCCTQCGFSCASLQGCGAAPLLDEARYSTRLLKKGNRGTRCNEVSRDLISKA